MYWTLLIVDSQDGLNYLGRIIACSSIDMVSRTGGVVVCTLSLHAEGPWFKSCAGGACGVGVGRHSHIWRCILILNKGEITYLVVHMDLE